MSAFPRMVTFLLALLLAFSAPAFALNLYPSNEGSYSVNFPDPPQEHVQDLGQDRLIARALREGDVIYIAAHGDFAKAPSAETEMNANIDNYAREIGAKVLWRKPVEITRGGRTVEGIRFAYDGEHQNGEGIVAVDGTSSYLVAASSVKPASHPDLVQAFLDSFRLEPKTMAK